MSGRHFSRSSEVAHLIADVRRMTPEDVLETYGIKILPDHQVFDVTFDETYKNLSEWAQACIDGEDDDYDDDEDKYDKYNDEDR